MTNHLSVTQLVRMHVEQYQRVAWFLIEWAEREQRVALRSLAAWTPPGPPLGPPQRGGVAVERPRTLGPS